MNTAQLILIGIGGLFILVGLLALATDKASDLSGASALRGIRMEGPAWLVLCLVGAGLIVLALLWNWAETDENGPPGERRPCEIDEDLPCEEDVEHPPEEEGLEVLVTRPVVVDVG